MILDASEHYYHVLVLFLRDILSSYTLITQVLGSFFVLFLISCLFTTHFLF